MASKTDPFPVYVEAGKKRAFAGVIDWPGWIRGGRDEPSALATLLAYGPRYAAVMATFDLRVDPPATLGGLVVVERLPGDGTTDFGAPAIVPSADERPVDGDADRFAAILRASWQAFDRAVAAGEGKELRRGPRGGGRELDAIVRHLVEGNRAYFGRAAWKPARIRGVSPLEEFHLQLDEALGVVTRAAAGEHPARGPRGGKIWPARYFVRRTAWHVLDHAWEIEDRII
jgi:hypothetical protein